VSHSIQNRFDLHVSNIIDKAARTLYGLKTIRAHGLTRESLHNVTLVTLPLLLARNRRIRVGSTNMRPGLVGDISR